MPSVARALLMVVGVSLAACSDAETPNANWDGGPPIVDGGSLGGRDEPCLPGNRCVSNDLTCVDGSPRICRLECDPDDTTDPCGGLSTCRPLSGGGGGGVCLPAGELDGNCPCDEGFACVNLGGNTCKIACAIGVDGGPDTCPANNGTCRPFEDADGGVRDDGVCVFACTFNDAGVDNCPPELGSCETLPSGLRACFLD